MRLGLLLLLCFLSGCSEGDRGSLEGEFLVVRACDGAEDAIFEPYQLLPDFFALERLGEGAFLRVQRGGKPLHRSDALVMEITDPSFIEKRLGVPIPFDSPRVRATLHLAGTCPGTNQAMSAQTGTITFQAYGNETGSRVVASYSFDLFDDRSGEVVGLDFRGELDFIVRTGQPYQPFAGQ